MIDNICVKFHNSQAFFGYELWVFGRKTSLNRVKQGFKIILNSVLSIEIALIQEVKNMTN